MLSATVLPACDLEDMGLLQLHPCTLGIHPAHKAAVRAGLLIKLLISMGKRDAKEQANFSSGQTGSDFDKVILNEVDKLNWENLCQGILLTEERPHSYLSW